MVLFNYSTKELTAKVVYYGPGLCGKTTNLQFVHGNLPNNVKGKMLSLATKTDRTLFFDFLPIDLGEIRGMKTRIQLYTVPGQVFYNETRKLVLKGADGIVFVADSQEAMMGANAESFKNLEENLKAHGMNLAEMPHVIQFNKRDLPKLASIEALNASINRFNAPFYESVATTGIGVQDTLKAITKLVLLNLTRRYDPKAAGESDDRVVAAAPVAPARPLAHRVPSIEVSAAVPEFDETEIDDLVDEVEEAPEPAMAVATVHRGAETALTPAEVPLAAAPADDRPHFEVDHRLDPDWGAATQSMERMESASNECGTPQMDAPPPLAMEDAIFGNDGSDDAPADFGFGEGGFATAAGEVTLTDVAGDRELFEDPSLEVARLGVGAAREIVVPVEVGEGAGVRRFKLTVRLRLDPVD